MGIQNFINIYKRLLQSIKYDNYRYIYQDFNIQTNLRAFIGPRGTGKTTLLLQYINEKIENKDKCIYVTLDHIYFANTLLTDFVNELYEVYGIKIFFFDEIHKYPNWNQELKNIYDSYPDIKIIFSGSSSIDLVKGSYDLSRRGVLYRLEGLSFREYLIFKKIANIEPIKLDNLLEDKSKYEKEINKIEKIRGYFKNYLQKGYYPYIFENENVYYEKLLSIIEKIIFEDISNFYRLKTENLYYFKKILAYISSLPPGELNYNNIAKTIGLDNKTIHTYINILNETGLVELVRSNKTGSQFIKAKSKKSI